MSRRVVVSVALLLAVVAAAGVVLTRSDDPAGDPGPVTREQGPGPAAAPTLRGHGETSAAASAEAPDAPEDSVPRPTGPIRLVVRVVDVDGETPLDGAIVTLERSGRAPESRSTAASGEATFELSEPGEVSLTARLPGRIPESRPGIQVAAVETHTVTLALERGVTTFGRVVRAEDGRPVVGARVHATDGGEHAGIWSSGSGASFGPVETDAEGRFHFPALPATEVCTFVVRAAGYAVARQSFFPRDAGTSSQAVVLRLVPGGRVVGRVYDPEGRPAAGATVQLDLEEDYTARTDADGRYAIDGLTFEQRYGAIASASGLADSEEAEDVATTAARPEVVVDLTLRLVSRLHVRLVDEAASPVTADGTLTLGAWPVSGWQAVRDDGATGDWRFDAVDPGDHRLQIDVPGYRRVDRRATVAEGGTTELQVVLRRGKVLSGSVVDDEGNPVPGARVHAEPLEGNSWDQRAATTDDGGAFEVGGLRAGPHRLRVVAGGHGSVTVNEVVAPRADVCVVLQRMAFVRLRLRLPAGVTPPAELWVNVETDSGSSGTGRGWTEDAIEHAVPPGPRRIRVDGEGFASWSGDVDAEPGDRIDLGTIALEAGVSLTVEVRDLAGEPVPGATVAMTSTHETWRLFAPPVTGRNGTVTVPHLNPGRHEVDVSAEGFLDRDQVVEVSASGGRTTVRLARGGLLRVRVRDAEGTPVTGAEVYLQRLDPPGERGDPSERTTDELGSVETRREPGRYRVWIGERDAPKQTVDVILQEGGMEEAVLRTGG